MPKLAIGRNMLRSVSRGNDPNSVAVSNNVSPQSRFSILDLESGTKYELRVTAYNNAGSTQAEYLFTTLSPTGSNRMHDEQPSETEQTSLFFDAHVLAPSVISLLAVFLAVAGVCFCLKTHQSRMGAKREDGEIESKGRNRSLGAQSTRDRISVVEAICMKPEGRAGAALVPLVVIE
ncbi:hypothetical protein K0M31_017490 [Melipona bicolor]|uniref:DSCAM/DSCAML C-terminal domain-containing protein n=1 Tax=Melipona bicolor TaxID=60889 RepID=A0AA40KSK8_9HYME|nr:hypothetical protein K0M31_017490 [Melipona bicolor]